ncbi:VOC family protein [Anaeromyxobacter sp. Fw109-5]|uniref:VOC family protein n=1 Tax=Anaeromyxobacter sp. (strain Fw109-5) TaxID=404589 RepID=UPI0002E3A745|nr:VOC family protein [Anaeromyxobacter sp. Fw109-5]
MIELRICIDVPDLERAVRFYTDALGLVPGRRFGAAGVELLGGPCPVDLLVKQPGTRANPGSAQVRDFARHWTPVHLDVVVPDLDAALPRALAAGATQEGEVQTHAWGRLSLLADPFGHGLCLLQMTGRGYDAIASG